MGLTGFKYLNDRSGGKTITKRVADSRYMKSNE